MRDLQKAPPLPRPLQSVGPLASSNCVSLSGAAMVKSVQHRSQPRTHSCLKRSAHPAITPATKHTHIHRDKMMMWIRGDQREFLTVVSGTHRRGRTNLFKAEPVEESWGKNQSHRSGFHQTSQWKHEWSCWLHLHDLNVRLSRKDIYVTWLIGLFRLDIYEVGKDNKNIFIFM